MDKLATVCISPLYLLAPLNSAYVNQRRSRSIVGEKERSMKYYVNFENAKFGLTAYWKLSQKLKNCCSAKATIVVYTFGSRGGEWMDYTVDCNLQFWTLDGSNSYCAFKFILVVFIHSVPINVFLTLDVIENSV